MKQLTINEITDKLIGHVDVYCETYHDNESLDNLKELEQVLLHQIEKLVYNYKYKSRNEASAMAIVSESLRILQEVKEILDEIPELQ